MPSCPACGQELVANAPECPKCGTILPTTPGGIATPAHSEHTSGMAIASVVFGVFGFLLLPAIVAVILGHLALREIARNAGRIGGKGLAVAGLLLGYAAIAVMPLLIFLLTIPNLKTARIRMQETTALHDVTTLTEACVEFAAAQGGFPRTLSDVVNAGYINWQPSADGQKADGSGESFSLLERDGYKFTYSAGPPDANGAISTFTITAVPAVPNSAGMRRFFTDQTALVRATYDGSPPTASSPPLQ